MVFIWSIIEIHSNDVQNTENNQILDNAIQKHNSNVKHKSIWDKPSLWSKSYFIPVKA